MTQPDRDTSLDTLLDLHGQTFFVDEQGNYWVKFEVRQVEVSGERPHGLVYSLTLHDASGERLIGFDNAHAMSSGSGPGRKTRREFDHRHRLRSIRPYEYRDAATLLGDFWAEVDAVLREKGALR
jgi:hypothetical protein